MCVQCVQRLVCVKKILHLLQIQHQKKPFKHLLPQHSLSLLSSFFSFFFSFPFFLLSLFFISFFISFLLLLSFSRYVVVQITLSNESGKKRCDQQVRGRERKRGKEGRKKEEGEKERKFRFFP